MANKESVIQKYAQEGIKGLGGKALKWDSTGFRFMPDLICLFPVGWVCFIEVKSENGRLSKGQKLRIKWLRSWGFKVWVPYNKEQVDEVINAINIELNCRS